MRGVIRGDRYYLDGFEVSKEVFDIAIPDQPLEEAVGKGLRGRCGVMPHPSDALAVHPKQVAEATQDAVAKGVPTEFLPDGRPIMRSRAHQKAYLKAYGFINRDGGYGD